MKFASLPSISQIPKKEFFNFISFVILFLLKRIIFPILMKRCSFAEYCTLANMCGDSYRVKGTINWLKRGEDDEIADALHSSGSIFN